MKFKLRHAWWLLLLIPAVAGWMRLRFDAEVLDLLPAHIPAVEGLKLYQEHFANAQDLIITVEASGADATSTAAESLADALRAHSDVVAEVTWQPPWMEHPEQAPELVAYLWLNQPPAVFRELAVRLASTNWPDILTATREQLATTLSPTDIAQLSYDPYGFTRLPESVMGMAPGFAQGQQLFSSADGRFRILFVRPRDELKGYRECTSWLAEIRAISAAAIEQSVTGSVRIACTGRPAFVAEISQSMRRDMILSSGGTAVIIAILFWLAHRRLRPMLWLLTLLGIILALTLAMGGLLFGTIHVISMGFAAILLGLAVDYAVVHYQEALAHPDMSIPQIRRAIAPSIFWAAITTIAAFLVLNFGGLPGLAQLGSLVAIGMALSAVVMIFAYLPPLFPGRMYAGTPNPAPSSKPPSALPTRVRPDKSAFWITVLLLLGCALILSTGLPKVSGGADSLQPRDSQAYAALETMKTQLGQQQDPLWVVVAGRNEADVAQKLDLIEPVLNSAVSNQWLASFTLPKSLWPHPANQLANEAAARQLINQRAALRDAALTGGFSDDAMGLANTVLDTWERAASATNAFWPTNALSAWILDKLASRGTNEFYAVGILFPSTNAPARNAADYATLAAQLPQDGVWLSGWELLGGTVLHVVKTNLWKLVVPMVALVLLSLCLAFRRPAEILLSVGSNLCSGLVLLSVMKLAGWSWNVLNLMALPLILGTGVDYGIFMQLALRRHGGDLFVARQSVGRALLLCGGTAIAGFGMLGLSSNAGMASLGQVCAVGIAGNMLLAVYLLPVWWRKFARAGVGVTAPPSHPSLFYRARLWSAGVTLCRWLPPQLTEGTARLLAGLYFWLAPHRRWVVVQNLLPILHNDSARAELTARKLFSTFATKLIDLWRYEGGMPASQRFTAWSGWEHFEAAAARGRGVILVTPHLGNWEFGGPSLIERGQKLLVLTQAEPDERLTRLRQESRARWGIETLVVGGDAFGFIETIKRLQSGACVALLVDRPPAQTGVTVELCGQPFQASIAAAELARASGCAIIPVYIVREEGSYAARMLAEVPYDRAAIGNRAARIQLTQEIVRALEPVIRQHADQWFHFVPVWKTQEKLQAPTSKLQ
jgi:uncharacterized protein